MSAPERKLGRDALDAARKQLDFSAISADAPSVKDILYKAQTMVPLAPPVSWKKVAGGASAVLLALFLLTVPVVPNSAALAIVKVQFENQLTRPQAQEIVFSALRGLPGDALVVAEFGNAPGQPASAETGKLQLKITSLRRNSAGLNNVVRQVLDEEIGEYGPFYTPPAYAVEQRSWRTIPGVVMNWFSQDGTQAGFNPADAEITGDILHNETLIAGGLGVELAKSGYLLEAFSFWDRDSAVIPESYDFMLPAWPKWVVIGVEGYGDLADNQQAEVRLQAEGYLRSINLSKNNLLLADQPGRLIPVMVAIKDPAGQVQPYLSVKLQAWIEQPRHEEIQLTNEMIADIVRDAMDQVFPGQDYSLSCQPTTTPRPGRSGVNYYATVSMSGVRRNILHDVVDTGITDNEFTEY